MDPAQFRLLLNAVLAPVLVSHGFLMDVPGGADRHYVASFSIDASTFRDSFPVIAQCFDLEVDDVELHVSWNQWTKRLSVGIEDVALDKLARAAGLSKPPAPWDGGLDRQLRWTAELLDEVLTRSRIG
jgi:hypothetical protein